MQDRFGHCVRRIDLRIVMTLSNRETFINTNNLNAQESRVGDNEITKYFRPMKR